MRFDPMKHEETGNGFVDDDIVHPEVENGELYVISSGKMPEFLRNERLHTRNPEGNPMRVRHENQEILAAFNRDWDCLLLGRSGEGSHFAFGDGDNPVDVMDGDFPEKAGVYLWRGSVEIDDWGEDGCEFYFKGAWAKSTPEDEERLMGREEP